MIAYTRAGFSPTPRPAAPPASGRLDQALPSGVRMSFARDEEVFGEGEPAEFVYRVLSGAVRAFRVLSDGRRQVSDFHLPGDWFGLEPSLTHRATVEALSDAGLLVVRRSALTELAQRDNEAARELWLMSARRLERSQDHLLMLGRRCASERVAGFLLDFADRLQARDGFDLPMSRQDIADYLGLTIETVSRTFSQLEAQGVIKAHNSRRIRLADRAALAAMCE